MSSNLMESFADLDLAPDDYRIVEQICSTWASPEDVINAVAGPREPIGELLLSVGRITPAQLADALDEQRACGEKLGELMVRKGWVAAREIETLIKLQARMGQVRPPQAGPAQLGNLLVRSGIITADQLQEAVKKQNLTKQRLGEVLIRAGYATPRQVDRGLLLQRAIATLALTVSVAISLKPTTANAASSMGGEQSGMMQASASLDFAIKIPAFLRVKFLSQPDVLVVSASDIQRGYIDVPTDPCLQVSTNSRDGFLLNIRGTFDIIKKVVVRGLSRSVEIDALDADATIQHPYRTPETTLALGYRFVLSPDARPGTYPWPMAISAATQY